MTCPGSRFPVPGRRGGLPGGYYDGEEARAYVGSYDGAYFSEDYFFGLGEAVGQAVGQGLGFFQVGQVVDGYLDRGVAGALDGYVGEAGNGSGGGANLLERDDAAAADGEEGLDGERSAHQRRSGADAAATAQVLQRVDINLGRDRLHPGAGRGLDALLVRPRGGRRGRCEHREPEAHAE